MKWSQRPLLCKLGLHARKKPHTIRVWHQGEYPWETWTHECGATSRGECARCGKLGWLRRLCQGPIYEGPRQTSIGYDYDGLPLSNRMRFMR
jgi:hypothetical protein